MDLLTRMSVAMATAWLAAGCDAPLTDGEFDDQDVSTTEDVRTTDSGGTAVVDFDDMNGTWAMAVDLSACVTVTAVEELRSQGLELVEIQQDQFRLTETHTFCQVRSTPLIGLETVVPEAVFTLPNPFVVESILYGTNIGADYAAGERVVLWGIEMENPLRDPMPEDLDASDPRVFDADGDGQPGVTLRVGGGACDLYAVQRDVKSHFGTLVADGSIQGSTNSFVEQRALGATNPICAVGYDIRSNRAHSTMKMVRVDERGINLDSDGDGQITCDEIVAQQDALIEWLEPDNTRCQ